jgi:hypothetical protein
MMSAVHMLAGMSLAIPTPYADQTAALQLGHFTPKPKSALGAHVTRHSLLASRLLVENENENENENEADLRSPGLKSPRPSEAVRRRRAAELLVWRGGSRGTGRKNKRTPAQAANCDLR